MGCGRFQMRERCERTERLPFATIAVVGIVAGEPSVLHDEVDISVRIEVPHHGVIQPVSRLRRHHSLRSKAPATLVSLVVPGAIMLVENSRYALAMQIKPAIRTRQSARRIARCVDRRGFEPASERRR